MTTPNLPLAWEPEACTLPTAERPLRLAEFDTLFTGLQAIDRLSPVHVRMHLAGVAGLQETVRDLTARETDCCSFFTFTTTAMAADDTELVTLEIEVPAEQAELLAALAGRAESIAAQGKDSRAEALQPFAGNLAKVPGEDLA